VDAKLKVLKMRMAMAQKLQRRLLKLLRITLLEHRALLRQKARPFGTGMMRGGMMGDGRPKFMGHHQRGGPPKHAYGGMGGGGGMMMRGGPGPKVSPQAGGKPEVV